MVIADTFKVGVDGGGCGCFYVSFMDFSVDLYAAFERDCNKLQGQMKGLQRALQAPGGMPLRAV